MSVRAKKHLGQHFLRNEQIARDIADAITFHRGTDCLVEIGPGTGALTKHLIGKARELKLVEIDSESIDYLGAHYPPNAFEIIDRDFLRMKPDELFTEPFVIAGNFPYNISSQILFWVFENRDCVTELVGMFQKEVAERVASGPGNKNYGILSVFLRAFFDMEYLFTVGENEFIPPPKVKSGVIRMRRNEVAALPCDETLFIKVVKTAFNQRRKTLRNSLRGMMKPEVLTDSIFDLRPERLDVADFVKLTGMV
jgi:16S rRNA (adenine1518-N6/adenine1519-N6)-dimethyltransferase